MTCSPSPKAPSASREVKSWLVSFSSSFPQATRATYSVFAVRCQVVKGTLQFLIEAADVGKTTYTVEAEGEEQLKVWVDVLTIVSKLSEKTPLPALQVRIIYDTYPTQYSSPLL